MSDQVTVSLIGQAKVMCPFPALRVGLHCIQIWWIQRWGMVVRQRKTGVVLSEYRGVDTERQKGCQLTVSYILCSRRGRTALGKPLAPIQALPWTWRPDSCCPLGTLCPAGAPKELKNSPSLATQTSGRKISWWRNPRMLISSSLTSLSQKVLWEGKFHALYRRGEGKPNTKCCDIFRAEWTLRDQPVR